MAQPDPTTEPVLTVSEITQRLKRRVEADFSDLWVRGEVSRVTHARSGHIYLTLKDEGATLDAAIWRSTVNRLGFQVEEGQDVLAFGGIDIYPPRGTYQLIVRRLEPVGEGALRLAFEQMRQRLAAEGLFDEEKKRALPAYPRRVAVVTSATGAAVRDLVTVMQRRWPALEIVLVPTRVQGEGSAAEIASAIAFADTAAGADVLVVGRGGGSLEDLWAFNEEVVARALAACETPVVSAVGHETDVTIADLVADVRAATPSQAGELVVPSAEEARRRLDRIAALLTRSLRTVLDYGWQQVESLADRPALRDPRRKIDARRERLGHLAARLEGRSPRAELVRRRERLEALAPRLGQPLTRRIRDGRRGLEALGIRAQGLATRLTARPEARLRALEERLRALSPLAVLGRGYSLTSTADGTVVRSSAEITEGDRLETRLADGGRVASRVESVEPPAGEDAS